MLKLKKRHPHNRFRIQETIVDSYTFKEYDLSEAAFNELKTKGVKHWVEMKDEELSEAENLEAKKVNTKKASEAAKVKAEKERLEAEAAEAEALQKQKELEGLNGSN